MSMMRQATLRHRDHRVSICVPCRDLLHSAFAFDLAKLIQNCTALGLDVIPHFCMGTLIVNQREQLAEMAIEAGSTHVLWLDSDMMFSPDILHRLLAHDRPVVAGNYVTRQYPHKTVAYGRFNDWRSYVIHGEDSPDLHKVEAVGMGCMLVQTDVMISVDKPRFQTVYVPESDDHMGEDFYFCQRLRALGHDIFVDNSVSLDLKHLGTFAFTHDLVRAGLE